MHTKTINIFLASSLEDLMVERNELQNYLSGTELDQLFNEDHTKITVIRCEKVSYGYTGTRLQEVHNQKIKDSQISVFLIKDDIHEGTAEEFRVAFNLAQNKSKRRGLKYVMFVYFFGDSKEIDKKIQEMSKGNIYAKKCHNIYEMESIFILELLKYERELLVKQGERYRYKRNPKDYSLHDIEFENYKEQGEAIFGEYEWHQERQKALQIDIQGIIQQILRKTESTRLNNDSLHTIEKLLVYSKIYNWANKTGYKSEEHCERMLEYANLLTQRKQNEDARNVCEILIPLIEDLYSSESKKIQLSDSYCSIGHVYHEMRELTNALDCYEKAYDIQKSLYGFSNPIMQSTITVINTIKNDLSNSGGEKKSILANSNMSI